NEIVRFGAASYAASASGGQARIDVVRLGRTSDAIEVSYFTSNGTATAGVDYVATSGTLTFGPAEAAKVLLVPILINPAASSARTATLTLASPTGGASLGTPSAAVLTITNAPAGGVLRFSAPTYSVSESAAAALITV